MTGDGSALRRRMWAMGMVDLHVDHVFDGTRNHGETRSKRVVAKPMDKPKPV